MEKIMICVMNEIVFQSADGSFKLQFFMNSRIIEFRRLSPKEANDVARIPATMFDPFP